GRWLLPPGQVFDPSGPAPDRVYSCRGYFLDPFRADAAGLDLDPDVLAQLDPVFHLTLAAGRQAWEGAVTDRLHRQRGRVILGHIALPTEGARALARAYLGRPLAERVPGGLDLAPPEVPHPLNRYPAGLPPAVLAQALGLGGGSCSLDAACASSLYALKLAVD